MTTVQRWWPWLGNRLLYSKLAFAVELATAFLMASEGLEEIEKLFPEIGEFSALDFSKEEVRKYREQATEMWSSIQKSFPEIYRSIQTKHAAQFILTKEKHTIKELVKIGILDERESMRMNALLDKSIYDLDKKNPHNDEDRDDRRRILHELDLFRLLSEEQQKVLLHSELAVINPDAVVYEKGERSRGLHIVLRGLIDVHDDENDSMRQHREDEGDDVIESFSVGQLAGVWSLMSGSGHLGNAGRCCHASCCQSLHACAIKHSLFYSFFVLFFCRDEDVRRDALPANATAAPIA
jgi:hypothetical protein